MKSLLFFVAVLVLVLLARILVRAVAKGRVDAGEWPFTSCRPLSRVEQVLYYRLVQTLPDHVVLAQVPLTQFLRVRKGRTWREWHDRISRKSIDFLVCDRDFTVVAGIELDDASHDSANRSRADVMKGRALAAARIPLVRWRTTALPDAATIRSVVDEIRRDRGDDLTAITVVHIVGENAQPGLNATHVEASNDASMIQQERTQ